MGDHLWPPPLCATSAENMIRLGFVVNMSSYTCFLVNFGALNPKKRFVLRYLASKSHKFKAAIFALFGGKWWFSAKIRQKKANMSFPWVRATNLEQKKKRSSNLHSWIKSYAHFWLFCFTDSVITRRRGWSPGTRWAKIFISQLPRAIFWNFFFLNWSKFSN